MEEGVLIAIKSGLSLIETCLRDILRETETDPDAGNWLFKERNSDLDNHATNELARNAKDVLAEIETLQRNFDIGKDTESRRWRIVNNLNQIWSTLSELSEDRLQGYRQMKPEEAKLLAKHVERMEAIRKNMEKIASTTSKAKS